MSLRRYEISVSGAPGEPERFQAEHEAILDALEHGRIERGAELVASHISNLKKGAVRANAGSA